MSTDPNETAVRELIHHIIAALNEYDLLTFDELQGRVPAAPATEREIEQFEKLHRIELPSDYKTFLRLHNGFSNFDGDGHLLSLQDHHQAWVKQKITFWNNLWDSNAPSPFERQALPILLGETKNSFLVLQPPLNSAEKSQFVQYDYMQPDAEFATFSDYLQWYLNVLIELIDTKKTGILEEG